VHNLLVNRKDWKPNSHTHVCSEHFVCGWHSDDPSEVNYAPTLFDHKDNRKIKNGEPLSTVYFPSFIMARTI
jgi:hypothetical protein